MNLTKVDWYGFRTKAALDDVISSLNSVYFETGFKVTREHSGHGWRNIENMENIYLGHLKIGNLFYGGKGMNGWVRVDLSGTACQWMPDFSKAEECLANLLRAEKTRIDLALDTFKGEVNHDSVLKAYDEDLFLTSGRPPKLSQILPSDKKDGRTIYIGKRENQKFLRAYEKGFEIVKDLPMKETITHLDGVPIENIYRLELELKPQKKGDLPEDIISRRDQYFAGAYPYLQKVLNIEPEIFVFNRVNRPQLALESMLKHIQYQYGNTLFTALLAYHGDVSSVWSKIVGDSYNPKLIDAGVLMVGHAGCAPVFVS